MDETVLGIRRGTLHSGPGDVGRGDGPRPEQLNLDGMPITLSALGWIVLQLSKGKDVLITNAAIGTAGAGEGFLIELGQEIQRRMDQATEKGV